jgi:hypothetical protein
MSAEYDRERTAALLKEAQEITSRLKVEAEVLARQMATVLDGREDETPHPPPEGQKTVTARSGWWFWR